MSRQITIQEWGQMIGRKVTIMGLKELVIDGVGHDHEGDFMLLLKEADNIRKPWYPLATEGESKIKPHLRRLTSMTVEEFKHCFISRNMEHTIPISINNMDDHDGFNYERFVNGDHLTMTRLHELGFDTSGMIDDGLAIEEGV